MAFRHTSVVGCVLFGCAGPVVRRMLTVLVGCTAARLIAGGSEIVSVGDPRLAIRITEIVPAPASVLV